MFIVWGTKVTYKKAGVAADFCSICRCPSVVDVEEISSQSHINYIGTGPGVVVGHACRCQKCKTAWPVEAGTIQGSVTPSPDDTLQTLILQTFPRFDFVHGDRVALEALVRRDPFALDNDVRFALIAEPFFALEGAMQSEQALSNTWQNNVGTLIGAAAMILGIVALFTWLIDGRFSLIAFLELLVTGGLGYFAYRLSGSAQSRFLKTHIYPRLLQSLSPLCPTRDELVQVTRKVNAKCAKLIKLHELVSLLELEGARIPVSHKQAVLDR